MAKTTVSFAKGALHERVQHHVAHVAEDVKALILTSLFLPLVLEPREENNVRDQLGWMSHPCPPGSIACSACQAPSLWPVFHPAGLWAGGTQGLQAQREGQDAGLAQHTDTSFLSGHPIQNATGEPTSVELPSTVCV